MAAGTLTVQELTDLRLGTLNTAVSDWEVMAGRLENLTTGGDGGVNAGDRERKANAADWKGVNATVSREFVTKTATQFADAAAEAKSVLGILRDAHTTFAKHQENLRTAIDDLAKRNIYVTDKGQVTASVPSGAAAGDADIHNPTDEELDAGRRRIVEILWEAAETDRIAARALRQLARDAYDFTDQGTTGLKDADREQGEADARYWQKEIAKGHVDRWSEEKLARFNETLKNQRDNPGFTENIALGLGPDGTLQFWRDLADPGRGHTPEGDRAKLLGDVQHNLSMSLANASHNHSPEMEAWKKDLIAAGSMQYGHDGVMAKPYGFQIMSNLMVKGKFDHAFLHDYGNALRTFETKTKKPYDPASIWGNPGLAAQLDYTEKGADGTYGEPGSDPMSGFLTAASHNPAFATELFNRDDMADYLLKDREFYDEDDPYGRGDGTMQSRDALGKALLAAGSGVDPDQPPAVTSYDHTDAQRKVLDGALKRLSGLGNDYPPELRDDMALLLGNHGKVVHASMSDASGVPVLDKDQLLEVTKQISRNQDSYGILNEQMNGAILYDIQHQEKHPEDSLHQAGSTIGFLEDARKLSINDKEAGDIRDATWKKAWTYHVVGGALTPLGGGTIGDPLQRGVDAVTTAWLENESDRISEGATEDRKSNYDRRVKQLKAIADYWYERNSDWAEEPHRDGYSKEQGIYDQIRAHANDGHDDAEATAGTA
ncbi:hypothetical protein [Streptomyces sp. NPDC014734]|uniref:hypothetical protein n=1 Tax=Streptomyces sp. NPDC014734 TaxID=3364886 RepID=UPI00370175BB